ncbi:hypothetical protein [Proteiniborus sp. MB09-C3]|uniref:hypothetical protein n=1 Tax=Proteiniborus sp. MB09-C3 TaxID=3050072 RepID=UPI002555ABE2|nr:hypothetical protein [Proteiniborus sp. MB09-C3]WIV12727.1 hypothetical protein QO263_03160 [Proteiniborus sp. MB09-C3]
MFLIIVSLITGFLGFIIGSIFGEEIFIYLFVLIGVLSPALFILQKIYMKLEESEKKLD